VLLLELVLVLVLVLVLAEAARLARRLQTWLAPEWMLTFIARVPCSSWEGKRFVRLVILMWGGQPVVSTW
jgi:hypothetical protein